MAFENTDWVGAARKLQPDTGYGAQRAGSPGMGGGSVPYAPGATSYAPSAPQQQMSSPPPGQMAGQMSSAPAAPPQSPQGQGQPTIGDPQRAVMFAEYLMARIRRQMAASQAGQQVRRG